MKYSPWSFDLLEGAEVGPLSQEITTGDQQQQEPYPPR